MIAKMQLYIHAFMHNFTPDIAKVMKVAYSRQQGCSCSCLWQTLDNEERQLAATREGVTPEAVMIGVESRADKYGIKQIMDTIARMSKKVEY